MIRYPIKREGGQSELKALEALIEKHKPGWLERAKERTTNFQKAGCYKEATSIWSEVKEVYAKLQHNKCAYCERELPSAEDHGSGEQDLEHFRPKNTVQPWPTDTQLIAKYGKGDKFEPGYYMLAYAPLNYCMACITCNRPLKHDHFPIQGDRYQTPDESPVNYQIEQPYLIYPIGSLDDDPEDHIRFDGYIPFGKTLRGELSIDFFNLKENSYLLRDRAKMITELYTALETEDQEMVALLTSPCSTHTNAAKSFKSLYEVDPEFAAIVHAEAKAYRLSKSPDAGEEPA